MRVFYCLVMPQTYQIKKGARYGHWKVVDPNLAVRREKGKRRRHYCSCKCMKCGDIYPVLTTSMVTGRSTQCANCRSRAHGEKVRSSPDARSCQLKISVRQREILSEMFGGDCRAVGRGVRKAVQSYRQLVEPYPVDVPVDETFAATTISLDATDKDWLQDNHKSIHHGIYSAIDYYLNK